MSDTVGSFLGGVLGAIGVTRLWGTNPPALPGLVPQRVADADLALLLAEADGRIGPGLGAAWIDGGILHLTNQPGGTSPLLPVADGRDLSDALTQVVALATEGTSVAIGLQLGIAFDEPLSDDVVVPEVPRSVVSTLSPDLADQRFVIVVGPGVIRGGHVDELAQLAGAMGCPVVNTWGAKGVFRWDSPFHAGTAGLQERDFELAGVGDADIVITSGLDPAESPPDSLGNHMIIDVPSAQLAALTYRWSGRRPPPEGRPGLYAALSAVVGPLYERDDAPISPPRAALHLSGARPDGGLVVADAGIAGFWIARTYPTGDVGSVIVPATVQPGFAVAAAHVAALDGRRAVAVCDHLSAEAEAVLELSEASGLAYGVQIWSGDEGEISEPADHVERSLAGFAGEALTIDSVRIDESALDALVAAAGPVVAWGGL